MCSHKHVCNYTGWPVEIRKDSEPIYKFYSREGKILLTNHKKSLANPSEISKQHVVSK